VPLIFRAWMAILLRASGDGSRRHLKASSPPRELATSFGVIPTCLVARLFGRCPKALEPHKLCEVQLVSEMELSRTMKFDRARRNALKSIGLVAGAVVGTAVVTKSASAATFPDWLCKIVPGLCSPPPGGGSGGGGNCFARGTQILTREGYRPIETLAAGDEVAVRGGFAPIKAVVSHTLNSELGKWVGESNLPVLIRRGALGENSPSADLCVTALHAVYVDGFLMPVGELVNGTSIIFEGVNGRDTLDFFNIELDSHDILDVQGALCESLYGAESERCAPLLRFTGGRSELRSRLRSVASVVVDRRQPIDIIRDKLEERAIDLAQAA
jgi:Hint domain